MISIALTTYNGERFLEEQLRSLNEQTTLPDELVVCDDRSTDRSLEVLGQFAKQARFPVRIIINDRRLGWRENFLKAASLCTSEYIAFCDQDDVWLPEKLSIVSRYLELYHCILLQHGYRLIDDAGNLVSKDITYSKNIDDALWRINFGFTQVFHRSLLEMTYLWELSSCFIVDDRMGHDNWIAFLVSLFDRVFTIDDVLVYYRQHDKNVTGFFIPVGSVNITRNLATILSRFYSPGIEFKIKRQRMIDAIQRRVRAAKARERIIMLIIPQVSEESASSRLRDSLQYYREFHQYQSQRLKAYLSESFIKRFQAVFFNYRQGLYQARGRQGAREAIADLVYGVAS